LFGAVKRLVRNMIEIFPIRSIFWVGSDPDGSRQAEGIAIMGNAHGLDLFSKMFCAQPAVLNFKKSHAMRNYGDETDDENHHSV
jgi:hypothetical protein